MPFVKLDTGILDSSLWCEPAPTCKCWVTLLAMADCTGLVRSTAPGIAKRAHLTLKQTERALTCFDSPDQHSRSLNDEGRKIMRVDGGYQIVNYGKYRDSEMRRLRRREYHREYWHKRKLNNSNTLKKAQKDSNPLNETQQNLLADSTPQKQRQSTEEDKRKRRPLSLAECVAYARTRGISASDAEAFFDSQESGGWTRGGKALRDWQAALRTWKANGWLPSQKQSRNGARSDHPKPIDKSKIDVPERFKAWVAEHYPARREDAMKWRTWADVPSNGLRDEWWKETKGSYGVQ